MVLLAIAKENNLDIEFIETEPAKGLSAEYKKLNPLGRVPTFEAPNGWVLSEVIAIAIYCTFNPILHFSLYLLRMSHIIIYSYPCHNPSVDL